MNQQETTVTRDMIEVLDQRRPEGEPQIVMEFQARIRPGSIPGGSNWVRGARTEAEINRHIDELLTADADVQARMIRTGR